MFNQSSQYLSLKQQVIALSQSYPCPRCPSGVMDPFGLTETFRCSTCKRTYVPLRGGRLLFPANQLGWKIAPTFWWDGFRWHWAGTTASVRQLSFIVFMSLLPVLGMNVAICLGLWNSRPEWCTPCLLTPLIALLTIQFIYLISWDFDFMPKGQ